MLRRVITPLEQGHLDSLCGVYSVINAIRLAADHADRSMLWLRQALRQGWDDVLFSHLVRVATRRRRQLDFVYSGLDAQGLARLMRAASDWLKQFFDIEIAIRRPFYRQRRVSVPVRCRRMAVHLDEPATAVVVGTACPWSHWTVVARVEPSRLVLVDSGGHSYAPLRPRRGYCDHHAGLIRPNSIFLVTLVEAREGLSGVRRTSN
jgi:hypothetical protein